MFVFMGMPETGGLGLSVKLPASGPMALLLPFATPTGYGLGIVVPSWERCARPGRTNVYGFCDI